MKIRTKLVIKGFIVTFSLIIIPFSIYIYVKKRNRDVYQEITTELDWYD